jgi:hypothetical protein
MFANSNYELQGRGKKYKGKDAKSVHVFNDSQYIIQFKNPAYVTGTSYFILPKQICKRTKSDFLLHQSHRSNQG